MKKRILLMMVAIMCIFALTACKGNENAAPTPVVTEEPTAAPTAEPTKEPTAAPTAEPTAEPTAMPAEESAKIPAEEAGSDAGNAASAAEVKSEAGEIYDGEGDFPDPGLASGDTVLPTPTPVIDDIPGGDMPYISGVDIPYNPEYDFMEDDAGKICEAYADYIMEYVQQHPEYKDTLRIGGGFIDDDIAPELFVMDSEDAKLRLVTYDVESGKVSVVDEIESNTLFGWVNRSGFIMAGNTVPGNTGDSEWEIASLCRYDKNGLIFDHEIKGMEDSEEYFLDGQSATEDEIFAMLEEYASFLISDELDDFEYDYADEYNYYGEEKEDVAEIIYDSIRWREHPHYSKNEPDDQDDPLEYEDDDIKSLFENSLGLATDIGEYYEMLSGNWSLNQAMIITDGEPEEVDIRKCKAGFLADTETKTVSLDFKYDDIDIAFDNAAVSFLEAEDVFGGDTLLNSDGKLWYGNFSSDTNGVIIQMENESLLNVCILDLMSDSGYYLFFVK